METRKVVRRDFNAVIREGEDRHSQATLGINVRYHDFNLQNFVHKLGLRNACWELNPEEKPIDLNKQEWSTAKESYESSLHQRELLLYSRKEAKLFKYENKAGKLEGNNGIEGIKVWGRTVEIMLFADDILIAFSRPKSDLLCVFALLEAFGKLSGFKDKVQNIKKKVIQKEKFNQNSSSCKSSTMYLVSIPLVLLLFQSVIGQPLQEHRDVDVDEGKDKDIFDINQELGLNLFEGDIKLQPNERNSIIGDQYRWPIPVPYYLEDSLEINAKALVLEAFERYRLKSCIDFKPWEGEPNYISVFKESGCWSYIGNLRRGKQQLSLGNNCDRLGTIQHEFLHALGFWHEQSRSDRDDYVTIMWDRILPGREGNFNKYNDTRSSSLNVPYDYTSVMHYSKTGFQIGTEPTIVTRIDAFSDVIGQRMDFSNYDLEKLNRLYNCTTFLSFLDTCDFEYNNICGMIQGTGDNDDWHHVLQVPYGPSTDHSNMGDCKDSGYFMHFDTRTLNTGDKAVLESRLFYPKRGFQCLEFFYYHNGNENDELNIWIREYTEASPNGTLEFITTVNGEPAEYWQLYHVPLSTNNTFRVVFEGVKGNGGSTGGISVDDINLSETRCPQYIWPIRNFTNQLNSANKELFSPPYYSKDGYAFQVQLEAGGSADNLYDLGIYFHLISGANDNTLQWPCSLRQATMTLMDQNPDIRKRMSNLRAITTDPNRMTTNGTQHHWDKPEIVGSNATFPNGTQYFRGPGLGTSAYITHGRVLSGDYLKGGDAFMLLSVDDVTYLNTTQPIPPSTAQPTTATVTGTTTAGTGTRTTTTAGTGTTTPPQSSCVGYVCENDGICTLEHNEPVCRCKVTQDWWFVGDKCQTKVSSQDTLVIAVSASVTIFVVMLIVTLVTVYCLKRKHQKQVNGLPLHMETLQTGTKF
ncbi:meprin A subunit beta [Eleutherodactylus coqui]|uniref:meprin A subunit beta n=1 Tax=Eleutherodactylus coqui TaxID=57060 RepID=UPI0034637911